MIHPTDTRSLWIYPYVHLQVVTALQALC